jgi:hypothetical protein
MKGALRAILWGMFPFSALATEQDSELVQVGGDKFLRWFGHEGRTYFLQIADPNDPLKKWVWAPVIESGNDEEISYEVDGTANKAFYRLQFTDIETTDPDHDDFDYDGLSNLNEVSQHQTNPLESDSDDDGMPDAWEIANSLDPNDDGSSDYFDGADGDPDSDGLINIFEYIYSGDPNLHDTDLDGLDDYDEVFVYGTWISIGDSDGDDLSDFAEIFTYATDPVWWDSDRDSLSDGDEVLLHLTNPLDMDTDGDWMWDDYELDNTLDPTAATDGLLDADGDTIANQLEFVFLDKGYDPFVANNPTSFPWTGDPDWDGLNNLEESGHNTNPNFADTDGDGIDDGDEVDQGSNPNDPNDSQPPPNGTVAVNILFGDDSGSHSEKYRLQLTPLEGDPGGVRFRSNRSYGAAQLDTFRLPKGAKYKIELKHIGTDPKFMREHGFSNYDWKLQVDTSQNGLVIEDPDNIVTTEEGWPNDTFQAEGKDATLYVPLFEWVTPKASPVTAPNNTIGADGQNEFTFDNTPAGVLTVDLKVLVKPTDTAGVTDQNGVKFSDRCIFILPPIADSVFAWNASNAAGKSAVSGEHLEATGKYTGLPILNSEFGFKEAEFECDNTQGTLVKAPYEVFFDKMATNHPEEGAGVDPNWFYYWKTGEVCSIPLDAEYDGAGAGLFGYVMPGQDTILRLGSLAAGTNSGPETFTAPAPYETVTVTGDGKGIKCCVETVTHELHHLTLYNQLQGATDTDGDGIADSAETDSNPNNPDTFNMAAYAPDYATYGDNEIKCRKMELTPLKYYPKLDWANPGCQSKNQFGPTP